MNQDVQDSIWAKLGEGKSGFENLHLLQNFAVKYVQQNFVIVQKMLVYGWLWKGQYILGSGHLITDPNGQNVDLCTRDFQSNFRVDPTVNELERRE